LTTINKLKVIEQLVNGVLEKKIAEEFGIGWQTVPDIKKQKDSIKTLALKFYVLSDKSSVSNGYEKSQKECCWKKPYWSGIHSNDQVALACVELS
jgi:transposase